MIPLPPIVLNLILILILLSIVVAIILYLIRAKKRGQTCIGCPYAGKCASAQKGSCSCTPSKDLSKSPPASDDPS